MTIEVAIPRNKWRKNGDMIQMITQDGLVDVFGAYLKTLGVAEELLLDHAMPKDLKEALPPEASWTLVTDGEGYRYDSDLAETIAAINDYSGNNMTDAEREEKLVELFASVDVKMRFYDEDSK